MYCIRTVNITFELLSARSSASMNERKLLSGGEKTSNFGYAVMHE